MQFDLMAQYANKPYCVNASELEINEMEIIGDIEKGPKQFNYLDIIGYFRGPEIRRNLLDKANFELSKLMLNKKRLHVDSRWRESLTPHVSEKFAFKTMRHIGEIIRKQGFKKKIYINLTGHGVGGVYAQIFGLLLIDHLNMLLMKPNYQINVYTYGAPRAGNSQFAITMNLRKDIVIHRITHSNDFAPHFPKSSTTGINYVHTEREFWIIPKNCDCQHEENKEFSEDVYECPGFFERDQDWYGESSVGFDNDDDDDDDDNYDILMIFDLI
ncbi:hypothetical protein G9A89_005107 [Geosiphon pyriformis]|nr:hypothetical protein G9A89_005107 [Geosiphon pyriformis]